MVERTAGGRTLAEHLERGRARQKRWHDFYEAQRTIANLGLPFGIQDTLRRRSTQAHLGNEFTLLGNQLASDIQETIMEAARREKAAINQPPRSPSFLERAREIFHR
jgi:hypothetical protein